MYFICFTEFESINDEICNVRIGIKSKVSKLRDIENKEELKGFHLQALSKEELESLEAVI